MVRQRLAFLFPATLGLAMALSTPGRAQEPTKPVPPAATKAVATKSAAGPATPAAGKSGAVNRESVLRIFTGANPMIWLLGACSIVTLGFGLERFVALRRSRVIPRDFIDRFHERLSSGKLDRERAIELCRANDSAAARVFAHAMRYWGMPAATIRDAVASDAAGEVIELKRNIRVLNGTSTLAPLIGLLGTVIGMIESFEAIGSKAGGAKSEALAQGISLALVSTAVGLGIAILSVSLYYFLLNKVDLIVRELDDQTRRVVDLISAETIRGTIDRRGVIPGDHARHESRIH